MEPERSIEKLLRGYAQRRLQSAEPAENLHPARRQALLSEVRLRYQPDRGGWHLPAWWPRLAWAFGCLLVLGISAAVWLPQAFVKRDLNGLLADGSRSTQSTLKLRHPASGTNLNLEELAAAPTGQALDSTNLPVDMAVTATGTIEVATAPIPEAAAQPDPAPEFRSSGSDMHLKAVSTEPAAVAAPGPVVQQFTQLTAAGATPSAAVAQRGSAHPVLTSFRMEQTGSEVRVVDQDGSVYSGSLEANDVRNAPVVATTRRTTALSAPNAGRSRSAPAENSDRQAAGDNQALQQYFFKVSGTNRSLNQKVLFTGNLIEATPASNQLQVMRQQVPRQMLLNNARITGRAQVGGQEIRVEAVPAP